MKLFLYYLFTEQPSLPSLSSQSSINAEPAVFKTTEFFSTLTDQGSVFKTTFDQVTTESFTQDKSGNIPEFSTSISSKQIPPLGNQNLQGFEKKSILVKYERFKIHKYECRYLPKFIYYFPFFHVPNSHSVDMKHQKFHIASARGEPDFLNETSFGCDVFRSFCSNIPQVKISIRVCSNNMITFPRNTCDGC